MKQYDIRWFDTTKSGKLVARKYNGTEVKVENGTISFTYGKKAITLKLDECFANVWSSEQYRWVAVN